MHDVIGVIAHCNAQHEGVLMHAGQLYAFSKSHHQKLRTVVEATKTSTEQKSEKKHARGASLSPIYWAQLIAHVSVVVVSRRRNTSSLL
jgi:hypothetical protein